MQNEDGTFSFKTENTGSNGKQFKESQELTAYVKSKEGYESEKITKLIPKMPDEVAYTFTGEKAQYLVVKGKIKKGETLKVEQQINDVQGNTRSSDSNQAVRTVATYNEKNPPKNIKIFASNDDGGKSRAVEQTIPDIVIYWDDTSQNYHARFNFENANQYIDDRNDIDRAGVNYSHLLSIRNGASLIKYKVLTEPSDPYPVVEFDKNHVYELLRYLDNESPMKANVDSTGSVQWNFISQNDETGKKPIASNSRAFKFISLKDVTKFIDADNNQLDPDSSKIRKIGLYNTYKEQWELRPSELQSKKISGNTIEVKGKIQRAVEGEFILLNILSVNKGVSNVNYNSASGEFTLNYNGNPQDNLYLYFKSKQTNTISFWINIANVKMTSDFTDIPDPKKADFEKLLNQALLDLQNMQKTTTTTSSPSAPDQEKTGVDRSKRSLKEEALEEPDNYPSEEALYQINEATTDKNDTRLPLTKFSTSLTEQAENSADTEAQQVNPTQPQKEDIPPQLLEEPKTAALQNPIELLNTITSEENTTADLTPSFTLNAPKEAPDAVKAVVTLDNRPEYELELIDNQGVFTVEVPLAEGPHGLKVKFIDPDGDWIRLDKTFTIDASSERILSSSLETPDRYQSDLSTGSKTSPSKEHADDILIMTPVLHLPEHEEESVYY